VVTLIVVAEPMMNLLYEREWQAAGPMLRILAVGAMGGLINVTYGSVLMAMKKTFQIMLVVSTHIVLLLVASTLGYALHPDPEMGFIWGVSLVEWLNYPVYVAVVLRYGLWQPRLDFAAIVVSAAATAAVFVWL
jgi:O-antigen/teichoic acid export membrane protein